MSETWTPSKLHTPELVQAVKATGGSEGLDTVVSFLRLLKEVARTDSIEEKSKSGREAAVFTEFWLDVQIAAFKKELEA